MKRIIGLLLILILNTSCSDGGVETINKPLSTEVSQLLNDVEALEASMADDLILRASTKEEISTIKNYLLLSRVLGLRLNQSPTDRMAAVELFKVLKKIESFPFSQRDAGLFEGVIHRLRVTLDKYATIQDLNLAGLEWGLFQFTFSGKLDPFKTIKYFSESPVWKFGRGGGHNFAKVESRNVKADSWLFSPTLDLTTSKKQLLIITHTVRNPEWDKFKVLISTDYDGADPLLSEWTQIIVKPSRSVQRNQWVNLVTNPIDISKFSGKKITLAFQFTADEKSNSVWEILGVEVKGTGDAIKSEELEITYEAPVINPPSEDGNL
ncbi:MAG: choice-of-anchor J domain-containing protein [Bacteriovoracaceae bacterium]|nr:choice-of-anchor J domain-containing protein [Bacteriovoracaceae bacterium]